MKYMFISLILVMFQNCTGQNKDKKNELQYVSYSAATRGSSFICKMNADSILIDISGVENVSNRSQLEVGDWRTLSELVKQLNLDSIPFLEAPTDNRYNDQVRIAEVEIKKGEKLYVSNAFDEGNPPKELKALVDKLLLLSQTVE